MNLILGKGLGRGEDSKIEWIVGTVGWIGSVPHSVDRRSLYSPAVYQVHFSPVKSFQKLPALNFVGMTTEEPDIRGASNPATSP